VGRKREVGQRAGALGPDIRGGGGLGRTKPRIEPCGLDTGGTCKITREEGGGALWAARERRGEELGPWGPICVKGAGLAHETKN